MRLVTLILVLLTSPLFSESVVSDIGGNTLTVYVDGEPKLLMDAVPLARSWDKSITVSAGVTGYDLAERVKAQNVAHMTAVSRTGWPGAVSDWDVAVDTATRTWRKARLRIRQAQSFYQGAITYGTYTEGVATKGGVVQFDTTKLDNAITAIGQAITQATAAASVSSESTAQDTISVDEGALVTTRATTLLAAYEALRDNADFTAGVHNNKVTP